MEKNFEKYLDDLSLNTPASLSEIKEVESKLGENYYGVATKI